MAIRFQCKCGKQYRVANDLAGKKGRCKSCGKAIQIPAATAIPVRKEPDIPPSQTARTEEAANWSRQSNEDVLFLPIGTSRRFLSSDYYALAATNGKLVLLELGKSRDWALGLGISGFFIGKLIARRRALRMKNYGLHEENKRVYELADLESLDVGFTLFGPPSLTITDGDMNVEEYQFDGLNQATGETLLNRFEAAKAGRSHTPDPEDSDRWILRLRPKHFWLSALLSFPVFFLAPIGLWLAIKDLRQMTKDGGRWGFMIFELLLASVGSFFVLVLIASPILSRL